jgi:alkanesulfonate monooxygenase SsuD/methylene tetrahydromethanopterin reductase-like flavin-dependent oxidoreductase (luciferase family)
VSNQTGILFGVNVPTSAGRGVDPIAAAHRAERLGFDFVSSSDHPCGTTPSNETWTMLTWIAATTSRIHIATRVLGVPYRNPAVLAKMAETFDRLSDGRLILGLGGGSADDEHRAFGLGVRSPKQKTDGLGEAVTIIRGLWSQPSFSFSGDIYTTESADIEPKPKRPIPIWLGTFAPRSLALTGALADGWIPSLGYASSEELLTMRERVLAAARDAGRRVDEITCALNAQVRVHERACGDDSTIAGPPDAIAERLSAFLDAGFSAVNFMLDGDALDEQMERVATEVIPQLSAR